jgi:hypothetical protein
MFRTIIVTSLAALANAAVTDCTSGSQSNCPTYEFQRDGKTVTAGCDAGVCQECPDFYETYPVASSTQVGGRATNWPTCEGSCFFTSATSTPAPTPEKSEDFISFVHSMPHSPDKPEPNDDGAWATAVLWGGLLPSIIGIVLLAIYFLYACVYKCLCKCLCFCCCKTPVPTDDQIIARLGKRRCTAGQHRMFFFLYAILIFAVLAAGAFQAQTIFKEAGQDFADALYSVGKNLREMKVLTESAVSQTDAMEVYRKVMVDDTTDTSGATMCATVGDALKDLTDSMSTLTKALDTVIPDSGSALEDAGDASKDAIGQYTDLGIVGCVALFAVSLVLSVLANMCGSLCLLDVASIFTWLSLLVMFVVMGVLCVTNVGVADLCSGSIDDNLLAVMNDDATLRYYFTCEGANPLEDPMKDLVEDGACKVKDFLNNPNACDELDGKDSNGVANSEPDTPNGSCGVNGVTEKTWGEICSTDSVAAKSNYDDANTAVFMDLADLTGYFGCKLVNEPYQKLAHEVMCVGLHDGLLLLWMTIAVAGFLLYVALWIVMDVKNSIKLGRLGKSRGLFDNQGNAVRGLPPAPPGHPTAVRGVPRQVELTPNIPKARGGSGRMATPRL